MDVDMTLLVDCDVFCVMLYKPMIKHLLGGKDAFGECKFGPKRVLCFNITPNSQRHKTFPMLYPQFCRAFHVFEKKCFLSSENNVMQMMM